jgi:hypothetical protein
MVVNGSPAKLIERGLKRKEWHMPTDISDPSTDEISFLRKLYDAGGELSLQGNVGLQKLQRLFPDYVTQHALARMQEARAPK